MTHGEHPPPAGADEALAIIAAELPALRQEVQDLREQEVPALKKKELSLTWWLAAAFTVALLALGAVGVLGFVIAAQNSDRIAAEARNTYNGCVAGNTFRAEDLATWRRVLTVVLPSAPEWQAKGAAILAAEAAKDTPRDCAKLAAAHSPAGGGGG